MACLIMIDDISFGDCRPDADEVWVIHWESADLMIPWHPELTARESILEWAEKELGKR